jgi:glyoxylase-like metal-dependent hydrolase (beta-lactamase superfamily II)
MLREIVAGVFAIEGLRMGRSYLIEGDGRDVALIDTSSHDVSERILAAMAAAGHRAEDLRLIVATHYHLDHTGNAGALRERTGAELCVHADDAPYVDGTTPWMRMRAPFGFLDRFAPEPYALAVDRVLRDGEKLPFAGGLRVIHAPGHTPGHIALYSKERRALFAGDALMNTWGLRLPMSMSTHDMGEARRTARRLAELEFEVALPGHGAPIIGRASEKIAEWARVWV